MKQRDTVAIVGVGLIGGSIGMALRARGLARHVVGIGRRAGSLRTARQMGAVTRTTLDLARGVAHADLVIVCTPVGRIAADVRAAALACRAGALITDVGSTKAEIVASLEGELPRQTRFVGSHPLAGGERSGPAAATADLLVDRAVIVTPTVATRDDDYTAVAAFWNSLGARVVRMSPANHDRVLAATSHLPHLAASALAAATPEDDLPLVAGGWLDTTRVASGDAELWRQIFSSNRSNVLTALARYEGVLASLRHALEQGDEAKLVEILAEAKRRRDLPANDLPANPDYSWSQGNDRPPSH
ncbi:MAG TPA: prephenate dehydrogenase/arogenate dehydrogenase family protein [Pirellulales bacterium]|nr:prephenate dehydrogenase/arogenate dehydrogenase family protein [Pirellulales bacterium]